MDGKKAEQQRIAIAIALSGGKRDEAEVRRQQRERLRGGFRIVAIACLLVAAILAAWLLLRPLPSQAQLRYTQGTLGSVRWKEGKNPHFDIAFEHETRFFDIDYRLLTDDGRKLLERIRPGMTARVGYTGDKVAFGSRWRAWELAVDGHMLYDLAEAKVNTQRQLRGLWIFAGVLFTSGVVLWWVTRPIRRRRRF